MPELSRFYGIVIMMFFDDHQPPHFHARYGEDEVMMNIDTLAIVGWPSAACFGIGIGVGVTASA
jgi:hypothetical protein